MSKQRSYSRYTEEASQLLGRLVRVGRKERRWTETELAGRAGISRATLQKIEKGDLGVAIGLAFEVAALVGVKLFEDDYPPMVRDITWADEKLALLPRSIRKSGYQLDDDF